MNQDEVYNFMLGIYSPEYPHDLIITFIDGYKYRLSDLELVVSYGFSGEIERAPIIARTNDYLNPPDNFRQAIKEKLVTFNIRHKHDGIYVIDYEAEDVQSIFNEYDKYFIYQK